MREDVFRPDDDCGGRAESVDQPVRAFSGNRRDHPAWNAGPVRRLAVAQLIGEAGVFRSWGAHREVSAATDCELLSRCRSPNSAIFLAGWLERCRGYARQLAPRRTAARTRNRDSAGARQASPPRPRAHDKRQPHAVLARRQYSRRVRGRHFTVSLSRLGAWWFEIRKCPKETACMNRGGYGSRPEDPRAPPRRSRREIARAPACDMARLSQ